MIICLFHSIICACACARACSTAARYLSHISAPSFWVTAKLKPEIASFPLKVANYAWPLISSKSTVISLLGLVVHVMVSNPLHVVQLWPMKFKNITRRPAGRGVLKIKCTAYNGINAATSICACSAVCIYSVCYGTMWALVAAATVQLRGIFRNFFGHYCTSHAILCACCLHFVLTCMHTATCKVTLLKLLCILICNNSILVNIYIVGALVVFIMCRALATESQLVYLA